MKRTYLLAVITVCLATPVNADSIGLHLGGKIWKSTTTGTFGNKNSQIDYGAVEEQQNSLFIAIEHPIPFLPNARISSNSLETFGTVTTTSVYSADTNTAHVDIVDQTAVDANFDINFVDYSLYYQVFDNDLLAFDLGLTARAFGGDVSYTDKTDRVTTTRDFIWDGEEHDDHDYHNIVERSQLTSEKSVSANDVVPMIYLSSKVNLPISGFSLLLEGNYSLLDDHTIYDYQLAIDYDLITNRMIDLNMNIGYQVTDLALEDMNGIYTNLEFDGGFIGFSMRF